MFTRVIGSATILIVGVSAALVQVPSLGFQGPMACVFDVNPTIASACPVFLKLQGTPLGWSDGKVDPTKLPTVEKGVASAGADTQATKCLAIADGAITVMSPLLQNPSKWTGTLSDMTLDFAGSAGDANYAVKKDPKTGSTLFGVAVEGHEALQNIAEDADTGVKLGKVTCKLASPAEVKVSDNSCDEVMTDKLELSKCTFETSDALLTAGITSKMVKIPDNMVVKIAAGQVVSGLATPIPSDDMKTVSTWSADDAKAVLAKFIDWKPPTCAARKFTAALGSNEGTTYLKDGLSADDNASVKGKLGGDATAAVGGGILTCPFPPPVVTVVDNSCDGLKETVLDSCKFTVDGILKKIKITDAMVKADFNVTVKTNKNVSGLEPLVSTPAMNSPPTDKWVADEAKKVLAAFVDFSDAKCSGNQFSAKLGVTGGTAELLKIATSTGTESISELLQPSSSTPVNGGLLTCEKTTSSAPKFTIAKLKVKGTLKCSFTMDKDLQKCIPESAIEFVTKEPEVTEKSGSESEVTKLPELKAGTTTPTLSECADIRTNVITYINAQLKIADSWKPTDKGLTAELKTVVGNKDHAEKDTTFFKIPHKDQADIKALCAKADNVIPLGTMTCSKDDTPTETPDQKTARETELKKAVDEVVSKDDGPGQDEKVDAWKAKMQKDVVEALKNSTLKFDDLNLKAVLETALTKVLDDKAAKKKPETSEEKTEREKKEKEKADKEKADKDKKEKEKADKMIIIIIVIVAVVIIGGGIAFYVLSQDGGEAAHDEEGDDDEEGDKEDEE